MALPFLRERGERKRRKRKTERERKERKRKERGFLAGKKTQFEIII